MPVQKSAKPSTAAKPADRKPVQPSSQPAAKARLEEAGVEYLGPDRGADDSIYIRDPNGVGLELYREDLGVFEGTRLLKD